MPHIEKQPVGAAEQIYVPASIPFEQSQRRRAVCTLKASD